MTELDLSSIIGDTIKKIDFTITEDGTPVNLTGAAITLKTFTLPGELPAISLAVGTGITITNAAAGQFRIDSQKISGPAGVHSYSIKVVLASGDKFTYVTGRWTLEFKG